MTNDQPNIPVGHLQLYDDYLPGLGAGNWFLGVHHEVRDPTTQAPINTEALAAKQAVVVSAPQFAIDSTELLSTYPPAGSTGQYGNVLPNVVLSEPMLLWERKIESVAGVRQPWLALLVLAPEEIDGGGGSTTGAISTTVGAFRAPGDGTVLKPAGVTKEGDVVDGDPMTYVQIPTTVFQAAMPRLEELRYLAHCRRANTGDRAELGLDEQGLFSVVVANRFPAVPAGPDDPPAPSVAHLISVEGFESYLVDQSSFGTATSVALVSLASWRFSTKASPHQDFQGLMEAILAGGRDGTTPQPDRYRLRLSSAAVAPRSAEAGRRLDDGFVALEYATRSGEGTFAWYRGPLTPYPVAALDRGEPFLTSDAAIAYQKAYGVFDLSLAAAFQIGRAAAIASTSYGKQLLDLRTAGHRFTDTLLSRLTSDSFRATDIAALSGASVDQELRALLKTGLLSGLREPGSPTPAPAGTASPPETSPQQALQNLLAQPDVQAAMTEAVQDDLVPVARWLGQLLLLKPVPFHHLVPADAMLRPESVRFSYLDPNWLDALLDGALAVGMESSRDTFFHQIVGDVVKEAAYDVLATDRASVAGPLGPAPQSLGTAVPMTCLLLRSAVVTGWPTLAVRPTGSDGNLMQTLRMERLSPTVLLCVFSGVPATIEIAEPQEGFRFGVDEQRCAVLRNVLASNSQSLQVGEQFPGDPKVTVFPDLLRDAANRVLNLAPGASGGAVETIRTAVEHQPAGAVGTFGPADLALQLVDAPESVSFVVPGGGGHG